MPFDELTEILNSMKKEADAAGVQIVTGDTKVVPHGKCDKIFINTSGIGIIENKIQRKDITAGDKIIINGTIGDHGMAIMGLRNNLSFTEGLKSDCAHLNHLIKEITDVFPDSIKFIRDATRGGVASVLNEIVKNKKFSAMLDEQFLPIRNEVRGISGILGIDPLYSANEGKIVIIANEKDAEGILNIMKKNNYGNNSAIIGEIDEVLPGKAYLKTGIGGKRILPLLIEEQLPRIC
jgi:hydrogenase expression/formation protein HypE